MVQAGLLTIVCDYVYKLVYMLSARSCTFEQSWEYKKGGFLSSLLGGKEV